jgi:hypothetical protein
MVGFEDFAVDRDESEESDHDDELVGGAGEDLYYLEEDNHFGVRGGSTTS